MKGNNEHSLQNTSNSQAAGTGGPSNHSKQPPGGNGSYIPNQYTWFQSVPASYNRDDSIELMCNGGSTGGYNKVTRKQQQPRYSSRANDSGINGTGFSQNLIDKDYLNEQTPLANLAPQIAIAKEENNSDEDSEQAENNQEPIINVQQNAQGSSAPKMISQIRKPDPTYIFYAIAGCLFFAAAGILRKYQGSNVLLSNALIAVSFMVVAIIHFTIQAIKKRSQKQKYKFPWQIMQTHSSYGEIVSTDKALLFWIFIGGALEFVGAQASVISFNGAISANLNGGLCGALLSLNTVFVLVVCYFMFNELINKIKFISICCLITSVALVSIFRPEMSSVEDMSPESSGGTGNTIVTDIAKMQEQYVNYEIMMIAGGLIASLCFGSQLIVFKKIHLKDEQEKNNRSISARETDTFSIGFGFLFFCGLIGFIALIIEFIRQPEVITELPLNDIIGPVLVGICTSLGIVAANIGAGIGIAGISNSIIHCSLIIVTLFNLIVFKQLITGLQGLGIAFTAVGLIILAFDDRISQCFDSKNSRSLRKKKKHAGIAQNINEVPIL